MNDESSAALNNEVFAEITIMRPMKKYEIYIRKLAPAL
jgi:hypothetical protein